MTAKNKQKAATAKAKAGFVPSKGDESYLEPAGSLQPMTTKEGKWVDGLGALSLGELASMANTINGEVEKAQKQQARSLVKIGQELLRARAVFRGDKEFGQWRKENTYIQSKQAANRAMRIAERFSSAPKMLEACSPSQLEELVTAPESLVKEIEAKVDAGEKVPPVAKIREAKSGSDVGPSGTSKKAITAFMPKADDTSIEDRVMSWIILPLEERIKITNNPWDILGLYRFAPVHPELIDAVEEYYTGSADTSDEAAKKVAEAAHKVRRELNS